MNIYLTLFIFGTFLLSTTLAQTSGILIYQTRHRPVTLIEDPSGCHNLPIMTRVAINLSKDTIQLHMVPGCMGPSVTIQPDHGSRVHGIASIRGPEKDSSSTEEKPPPTEGKVPSTEGKIPSKEEKDPST